MRLCTRLDSNSQYYDINLIKITNVIVIPGKYGKPRLDKVSQVTKERQT